MTALPQRKITDHKDNPIIAALIAFVTDNLSQSLDDISNYEVIQQMPESGAAEFSLSFGDGSTRVTGTLVYSAYDQCWIVRTFRFVITATGSGTALTGEVLSGEHARLFKGKRTYQEKCAYIAAHAKPEPVTAEAVHEQITQALAHPVLDLFLTADDIADATIRKIQQEER